MACVYLVGVLLLLEASGEKLAICGGDGLPAANQRAAWDYIHSFYSCNDMYSGTRCYYVLKLQNNL